MVSSFKDCLTFHYEAIYHKLRMKKAGRRELFYWIVEEKVRTQRNGKTVQWTQCKHGVGSTNKKGVFIASDLTPLCYLLRSLLLLEIRFARENGAILERLVSDSHCGQWGQTGHCRRRQKGKFDPWWCERGNFVVWFNFMDERTIP